MKNFGLFLLGALVLAALTACNDSDGDYARNGAFVTVKALAENDYFFELDDNKTAYPSDKTRIGAYNAVEGRRVVIYFNLLPASLPGYDYNIALYAVQEIYSGQTRVVSTEEELDELPDDKTSYIGYSLDGFNYLNLGIGFYATDLSKHKFLLVRNDVTELDPENKEEGYLNLELRHDAGGDTSGYDFMDRYVSFPLDEFREELADKKGVVLRVNTRYNKVKYIRLKRAGAK